MDDRSKHKSMHWRKLYYIKGVPSENDRRFGETERRLNVHRLPTSTGAQQKWHLET